MSSNAVRLCILLVNLLIISCAAIPVGSATSGVQDDNIPSQDVFLEVARILSDASNPRNAQRGSKPRPRLRHQKHHDHNQSFKQSAYQPMLKDAQWEATSGPGRQPRDWRSEMYAPQPAYPAYPYQQQPQTYQHYTGHPYFTFPYPGYNAWYGSQIPNYEAYNVPPETEWRTTVHEGPDADWTVSIGFPGMDPIILTNKNYSRASNVKVIVNKGDIKGRNRIPNTHIPIPGPVPVDPTALLSSQYSYSPANSQDGSRRQKNKQQEPEPITWTAEVNYGDGTPVVYRGSQASMPQPPVHYVSPPQNYYPSYNPMPAPAPGPWMMGPRQPMGRPSPAYTWPSAQVYYPGNGAYNPRPAPPQGTSFVPSFGGRPLRTDEDDTVDEDSEVDNDDNGDGDEDKGDNENDEEDTDNGNEENANEEEPEVADSGEEDESDEEGNNEDNNIETTTKKGLFSWG